MDFRSMKRKKLQKLCKKHNLPANLTNLEMAHKLSSLFKIEEKGNVMRQTRSCLKSCLGENEEKYDGFKQQQKKVRFSPENEVFVVGDYHEKTEFYELKRVNKEDRENLGSKTLLDQMVVIQPRHLN